MPEAVENMQNTVDEITTRVGPRLFFVSNINGVKENVAVDFALEPINAVQ